MSQGNTLNFEVRSPTLARLSYKRTPLYQFHWTGTRILIYDEESDAWDFLEEIGGAEIWVYTSEESQKKARLWMRQMIRTIRKLDGSEVLSAIMQCKGEKTNAVPNKSPSQRGVQAPSNEQQQ